MSLFPGWESERKHIFVLTSSGKPIFTKHGDEQDLVTTFGLIQAVISIVLDSGDKIKFIKSGSRKILFLLKRSLYFVLISSTQEPEIVLIKQLEFIYDQILFVLTSKVNNLLENNPSTDIRNLLGVDSNKLILNSCKGDLTPNYLAFQSISSFPFEYNLRKEIINHLKHCIVETEAV